VRDFVQLPPNCRVDFWMPVAVQIGPNRGVGIKKLAPLHVAQHRALPGHDDQRLAAQPVAHLRKRMPDKFLVELGELVHASKG